MHENEIREVMTKEYCIRELILFAARFIRFSLEHATGAIHMFPYYFSCPSFFFPLWRRGQMIKRGADRTHKKEIRRKRERERHNFRSMHSSLSINFKLTSNFNFHEKQKFTLARKATIHPNANAHLCFNNLGNGCFAYHSNGISTLFHKSVWHYLRFVDPQIPRCH